MDEVTSNIAKVTNIAAVEAILEKYDTTVEFDIKRSQNAETGTLRVMGIERPQALLMSETPDEKDYPTEEDYFDALYAKLWEDGVKDLLGSERFLLLLAELKPYFASPLKIVYLDFNDEHCCDLTEWTKTKWTVHPKATGIEITVSPLVLVETSVAECDTASGKLIGHVETPEDQDDELAEAVLQITGDKGDLQRIAEAIKLLSDVTVELSTRSAAALDPAR